MKSLRLYNLLVLLGIVLVAGCASHRPTLAERCQDCAELFPPKVQVDTFWDVRNFPIEEFVYIYEDTIECPEFITEIDVVDTDSIEQKVRPRKVPIRVEVPIKVERKDSVKVIKETVYDVDSVLLARNKELDVMVQELEISLQECQAKSSGKISTGWWLLVLGIAIATMLIVAIKK